MFWRKNEQTAPQNISALMDQTVGFMTQLRDLGGFGYIVFGAGLLILVAIMVAPLIAAGAVGTKVANLIDSLTPIAIALLILGYASVLIDKLLGYRLASIKLKMIVSVTEAAVNRALSTASENRLDTSVVKTLIREILAEIWERLGIL